MSRFRLLCITALALTAGCGGPDFTPQGAPSLGSKSAALTDLEQDGKRLFGHATFGGNGRTCQTCHSARTGTLSTDEIQALYARDPDNALFRAIDSDDGTGASYNSLLNDGTVTVTVPLPPGCTIIDNPTATSITIRRSIPTVRNIGLDSFIMWDGREPDLESQAKDAISGHAQATIAPTPDQLQAIAAYQKTLYTSEDLKQYAAGGPPPELPEGRTESEKRGRRFFLDTPDGWCSRCHSGPMLNQVGHYHPFLPPGARFSDAGVAEINMGNNPTFNFRIVAPWGTVYYVPMPDLGRYAITGDLNDFGSFKTPTLWGVSKTGPYFHDGSAKTLEDVAAFYNIFFQNVGVGSLSAQDQADIVAYLKLL